MRPIASRMRKAAFGASMGAALVFGTAAALAEPLRLPECTDPRADGPCATDSGCRSYCEGLYGPGTAGACNESTACCYCIPA